jgi:hypothetical protein
MIVPVLQVVSLINIFFVILLLTYISPKENKFADWRRVALIAYAYILVVINLVAMIWIGKQSFRILLFAPTCGFMFFFIPIIISIMITVVFVQESGDNLKIGAPARDYLITLSSLLILIDSIFLVLSFVMNARLVAIINVFHYITR